MNHHIIDLLPKLKFVASYNIGLYKIDVKCKEKGIRVTNTPDVLTNEGEEVALQSPEAIEAFKMPRPSYSYRKQKMEEMGLTEDENRAKQFEMRGEIPKPLTTVWDWFLCWEKVTTEPSMKGLNATNCDYW